MLSCYSHFFMLADKKQIRQQQQQQQQSELSGSSWSSSIAEHRGWSRWDLVTAAGIYLFIYLPLSLRSFFCIYFSLVYLSITAQKERIFPFISFQVFFLSLSFYSALLFSAGSLLLCLFFSCLCEWVCACVWATLGTWKFFLLWSLHTFFSR